jgi:hypothetical protein
VFPPVATRHLGACRNFPVARDQQIRDGGPACEEAITSDGRHSPTWIRPRTCAHDHPLLAIRTLSTRSAAEDIQFDELYVQPARPRIPLDRSCARTWLGLIYSVREVSGC